MQEKFLKVEINNCLSLNDKHFSDSQHNIDYLSESLNFETVDLQQRLNLATKSINLCEKFHSYFHFEQSYFHLLLGKKQAQVGGLRRRYSKIR